MIPTLNPSDQAIIVLDWASMLGDDVDLTSVAHIVPDGLVLLSEATDTINKLSSLKVSGATHGAAYQVKATATLSNSEQVTRVIPARAFNS